MCMEDIRIGQRSAVIQYTPALLVASAIQILPRNLKRIAVIFAPILSDGYFIGINNALTAANGFFVNNAANPVILNISQHGFSVCSEWWARSSTVVGLTPTIIEICLNDENPEPTLR